MLRKLSPIFVILMIFTFSIVFITCGDKSSGNSLKDVETWTLTFISGYGGDDQTIFDPYYRKFISESDWNKVRDKVFEDTANTHPYVSWFEIEKILSDWSFNTTFIMEVKSKLASDEKATYFYKNTNDRYRYIRIFKN